MAIDLSCIMDRNCGTNHIPEWLWYILDALLYTVFEMFCVSCQIWYHFLWCLTIYLIARVYVQSSLMENAIYFLCIDMYIWCLFRVIFSNNTVIRMHKCHWYFCQIEFNEAIPVYIVQCTCFMILYIPHALYISYFYCMSFAFTVLSENRSM